MEEREGTRQDLAVWFRIKYYDKNVAWITWKYAYAQYAVSLYRFCRMAHCVVLCSHVACFPNVTITVRPRSHCYLFPQRVCMYSKPVPKYPSILRLGQNIVAFTLCLLRKYVCTWKDGQTNRAKLNEISVNGRWNCLIALNIRVGVKFFNDGGIKKYYDKMRCTQTFIFRNSLLDHCVEQLIR